MIHLVRPNGRAWGTHCAGGSRSAPGAALAIRCPLARTNAQLPRDASLPASRVSSSLRRSWPPGSGAARAKLCSWLAAPI